MKEDDCVFSDSFHTIPNPRDSIMIMIVIGGESQMQLKSTFEL